MSERGNTMLLSRRDKQKKGENVKPLGQQDAEVKSNVGIESINVCF